MSNIEPSTSTLRVAPAESDSYFLDQVEFEDDIAKASVWFHKLMIHRIRDIDACARPISQMFSQHDGRFCNRFFYYCRKLKRYKRSDIPRTYIDRDYRIASILVKLLESRADDRTNIRCAERLVNKFYRLITDNNTPLSTEEFNLQIDSYCNLLIETFAKIGDDFAKQESGKKRQAPLSKEDVKQIAQEQHEKTRAAIATEGNATRQEVKADAKKFTLKQNVTLDSVAKVGEIVKRIDDRDKRYKNKSRAKFDRATLDKIWTLWETGKRNPEIKYGINTKVGYEAVFNYYRSEFVALGVKNADMLRKAIKTRGDQIRREKAAASKK